MSSKYFSPEEAAAKLGKQVWARRHFDGMPQGTVGKVTKAIERDGGAALLIEWRVRAPLEDVIRDSWARKARTPNLFNKHLTELSRDEYKRYTHDEDNPPFGSRVAKWILNLALFIALVAVLKGVYVAVTSGDARELREVWTLLLLGSFVATIARIVALSGWLRWSRVWGPIVHFFSLFFVPAVLLLFGYEFLNGNTLGAFGAFLVGGLLVLIQHARLRHLVASLSPRGLLEWLVAHQEAATREAAFNQLTIPARLACFSSEAEMVEKLQEETPGQNATVIAGRFLIEYITAQPPNGLRPISMSVYDHLLALAWHITNFGFESDLIHFGIAEHKMEILPSGRLGADRQTYEKARSAYMPTVMQGDIRRSSEFFDILWRDVPVADASSDSVLTRLNAAMAAEFGFSLTEQLDLIMAAMQIGQTTDPAITCLPRTEFTERMVQELNWPPDKVSDALNMLSLIPRDNFLNPDAPFRGEDVYPWRFNRALSYLRRPFLIRHRGDAQTPVTEVLWGIRHLNSFWKNITTLCRKGRLKARTTEMIKLMGEFNRERGEKFNDSVADVFARSPRLIVRKRVKKVGSLRLKGPKGDLGDIDVLVADQRRKRLIPVECKDLALARTPYEMSGEIGNLFHGTEGKKSIVELHGQRVQWIREHLTAVLDWLGVNDGRRWKVEPLIVVDRELFTPYLQSSPIPIVPIEEIRRTVAIS